MRDTLVLFTMIKNNRFQNYSNLNGRFCFVHRWYIESLAIGIFRDSRNLSPAMLFAGKRVIVGIT